MQQVFISYARADDVVLAAGVPRWVTALAERLQKVVGMRRGGHEVTIWMDHSLHPNHDVDSLLEQVSASACLVVVMSPRYLESRWCQREIATFIQRVGRGCAANRAFVVEMSETQREDWHPGIRSLTPLQFWEKPFQMPAITLAWPAADPSGDRAYWSGLNRLADVLAKQLQALREVPPEVPPALVPARPCVWIADPTDDLLDEWNNLADALRQSGCEVLPAAPGAYIRQDDKAFQSAMKRDHEQAGVLLQLLGANPGRAPPGSLQSYVELQSAAMRAHIGRAGIRKVAMLWRKVDIDLEQVRIEGYRQLLTGAISCGFESFRQQVLERLTQPAVVEEARQPGPTPVVDQSPLNVCVDAESADRQIGKQVVDLLSESIGVDANLLPEPSSTQSQADWRRDYERILGYSHGLIVVYGRAPPSWVQAELQAAKKLLAQFRRGTWGALLDGPPVDKPDLGARMHNLMLLNCRGGLAADALLQFVDALRKTPPSGASADNPSHA